MKLKMKKYSQTESNRWSSYKGGFRGLYLTSYGRWWGYCHKSGDKNYRFYLYDPPKELRNHPHRSNFYSGGGNWYGVAFARYPVGLEEGIRAIEGALCDAFEGKKLGQSQAVPIIKRKRSFFKKIKTAIKPRSGLKN